MHKVGVTVTVTGFKYSVADGKVYHWTRSCCTTRVPRSYLQAGTTCQKLGSSSWGDSITHKLPSCHNQTAPRAPASGTQTTRTPPPTRQARTFQLPCVFFICLFRWVMLMCPWFIVDLLGCYNAERSKTVKQRLLEVCCQVSWCGG